MPRGTQLTDEEQGQIRAFNQEGHSNRWIAKELGRSARVINNYLKNPDGYGKNKDGGRPPKLSDRTKRKILNEILNSTKSCRQVRDEVAPNVSNETVRRV